MLCQERQRTGSSYGRRSGCREGDFAGEKSADLGRPVLSATGEGAAFLTKGLFRTDMVVSGGSRLSRD